jgi:hypothetical protein
MAGACEKCKNSALTSGRNIRDYGIVFRRLTA